MARLFRRLRRALALAGKADRGGRCPAWRCCSFRPRSRLLALHTMKLVVDTVVVGPATADKGSAFGRVAKGYYR
jgi:hypothetical protein